jgi:hypothetical protein
MLTADTGRIHLYYHGIELFLKAFLRARGFSVRDVRQFSHNVGKLGRRARGEGLDLSDEDLILLKLIAESYKKSRYIETGFYSRPRNEALWGLCSLLFDLISQELIQQGSTNRLPVRPNYPKALKLGH